MISSGVIGMPLHFGRMPGWFTDRMGLLGSAVIESVIQNYGKSELLSRMSDPNWFQALGAVIGYAIQFSSGVTAAVLGSVRRKINPKARELGIHILGGKGKSAWRAPHQIERVADQHGLAGDELVKSCQLTRRVDSNCVQDGYDLYQQHVILSDEGDWTAIQQGLNTSTRQCTSDITGIPLTLKVSCRIRTPVSSVNAVTQSSIWRTVERRMRVSTSLR